MGISDLVKFHVDRFVRIRDSYEGKDGVGAYSALCSG
jgi:hypothetical protein